MRLCVKLFYGTILAQLYNMATIRKKGDFQWHVQIRKRGFPPATKTFSTKAEADAWATIKESEMVRGVFMDVSESERNTIGDIIERFTKEYAPFHYTVREDGKEAWRFQCSHLKREIGKYSLAALDQKLVAQYRDDRLKEVKATTVRKELFMLSKVLGFAQTEAGIVLPRGNPVEKIRMPSEGKSRDRRLDADEWSRFVDECKASRNRYLWPSVQLAIEMAARQGELLSLTWKNIDKNRGIALLRDTKNGEDRAAPLSSRALAVLASLPESSSVNVLPVQRMTLYHVFHAAVLRAGIKDFTFHDLRHEAISRLAERGDMSMLELASISGHKTLQMLKRYTHLQAENLAKKLG